MTTPSPRCKEAQNILFIDIPRKLKSNRKTDNIQIELKDRGIFSSNYRRESYIKV